MRNHFWKFSEILETFQNESVSEKVSKKSALSPRNPRLKNSEICEFVLILKEHKSTKNSRIVVKKSSLFSGSEEVFFPAFLVANGVSFRTKILQIQHFLLILLIENVKNFLRKHVFSYQKRASNSFKDKHCKGISKSVTNRVRNTTFFIKTQK